MIKTAQRRRGYYSLLLLILYVWAGMLIGISFLEAPLKFQAPNITLALGLGIGRLVFNALNKIEILFAVSLAGGAFLLKVSSRFWILCSAILLLLIIQSIWLLPALDERAEVILKGGIPDGSSPHIFYVVAEFSKLFLIITLGIRTYLGSFKDLGGLYDRND